MPEPDIPAGTFLGFDFGMRRIGVAVGQATTRTANALTTISNSEQPDWQGMDMLVKEWLPAGLVVGLPFDAEGKDTRMSGLARSFGKTLETRYQKPVFYCDERLTSSEAGGQFIAARAKGQARRKDINRLDAVAAKIILENWLQSLPVTAPG